MRSRSTSKHGSRIVELERIKLNEEPHLSGAYIRNLVKELSSSVTKGPTNPRSLDGVAGGGEPSSLANIGEGLGETQRQSEQEKPIQPRKQVRRRVHTSRPYQERLINMAEARREIVTALRFHRAAMKRASEQQQQQQQKSLQPQAPSPPPPSQDLQKEIAREVPRVYPSNNSLNTLFSYLNNPYLPSASYPELSWPLSSIPPLPIPDQNLNFTFPSMPLGLNLNIQGFNNVDINLYDSSSKPPMLSSASSTPSSFCSYSFASPMTGLPTPGDLSTSDAPLPTSEAMSKPTGGMLHPTMGDEEMAQIRSIGEQHDMEWNDKMNLVTSAWWCELFKTMEVSPHGQEDKDGVEEMVGNDLCLFDEVLDVPQQIDDYYYSSRYLHDASLPCLDIGEIEGSDCEWLS